MCTASCKPIRSETDPVVLYGFHVSLGQDAANCHYNLIESPRYFHLRVQDCAKKQSRPGRQEVGGSHPLLSLGLGLHLSAVVRQEVVFGIVGDRRVGCSSLRLPRASTSMVRTLGGEAELSGWSSDRSPPAWAKKFWFSTAKRVAHDDGYTVRPRLREGMAEMRAPPVLQFEGKIIDVFQHAQAAGAIDRLLEDVSPLQSRLWNLRLPGPTHAVGFDVEWQPEFVRGQSNPVALIQLATESVCVIFYMLRLRTLPTALKDLLLNEDILKVSPNHQRSQSCGENRFILFLFISG